MAIDVNKSGRPFEGISFSDVDCIKALIKFRSMFDRAYGFEYTDFDEAGVTGPIIPEVIAAYATLDNYLEKCNLNIKQRFIIKKFMEGNTEADIAKMFKTDPKNISSVLNTVAGKVKKMNDLEWKYNFVYTNVLKGDFRYKKCVRCEEEKPATEDFFGRDLRNLDGLKSHCRLCETKRRK